MNVIKKLPLLLALSLIGACNTLQTSDDVSLQTSSDPFQGFNRKVYAFNDGADKLVLKPIAKTYNRVVPSPARTGVSHFFDNLGEPMNVLNNLLQGKFDRALQSTYRFTVNSTIGLFGLFDVAKKYDVIEQPEDLGQTLAAWGVAPGPYLVIPFLGPSNLRDSVGRFGSSAMYFPNSLITDSSSDSLALTVLGVVDTRAGLIGVDSVLSSQLDPYLFLKVAYENARIESIYDGSPPERPEEEFDF